MIGVIIGIILIAFGCLMNSWILIFLGVAAGILFTALNRPAKIRYVEVEPGPEERRKHIVISPPPPKPHYPTPSEMQAPFGRLIQEQTIKVEVKKFKKMLRKKGKSPTQIRAATKKFKKQIATGKKLIPSDTFPYFVRYPKHPMATLFTGLPIAMFRKTFGKEKDVK